MMYHDDEGNVVHHFDVPGRHSRLTITAEAIVERLPIASLPQSLDATAWETLDEAALSGVLWDFLNPSTFARPTHHLVQLGTELALTRAADPLTTMRLLSADIHAPGNASKRGRDDPRADGRRIASSGRTGIECDLRIIWRDGETAAVDLWRDGQIGGGRQIDGVASGNELHPDVGDTTHGGEVSHPFSVVRNHRTLFEWGAAGQSDDPDDLWSGRSARSCQKRGCRNRDRERGDEPSTACEPAKAGRRRHGRTHHLP